MTTGAGDHIPDVSTKPNCKIRAIPKFPQQFVARVENLSNADRVELIRAVPGKLFLFERFVWVDSGSREVYDPSPREL